MRIPVLLLMLVPALASAAPPSSLQFVPTPNSTAQGVVPMPNGSVAVFGVVSNHNCVFGFQGSCDQMQTPLLSILSASGTQTAALPSTALGGGNSSITGAAIDANGNFWIVGETDSDDFPLVQAISTQKPAYKQTGFAAKLDPNFNVLFATFIGGQPDGLVGQPNAVSVALDSAGNAYVAGNTWDPMFPTTGPVFGTGAPTNGPGVKIGYTFLVKISADGSRLLFSRLLGGNQTAACLFPQCPTILFGTSPRAIVVDANGNVTIVGGTTATNFPITANAYVDGAGAFASRISADGSQLIWSTTLGSPPVAAPANSTFANSVVLDAAGDVYITGITFYPIATTPGALQPAPPSGTQLTGLGAGNGFALKLSTDGTQLLFATNLATGRAPAGVAVDLAGNVWITGDTFNSNFPGPAIYAGAPNVPPGGLDFALELNANATAVQQLFTFLPPTATQPPAFDSNGNLLLLASSGNLVRLNPANALTAPAVFAMTNSAIPQATASVGPGELLTLYGVGLGPETGVTGEPDLNGLYPTQLAGVTASVNGLAAPLLYVGHDQINFQMIFNSMAATPETVVITTPGGSLLTLQPQAAFRSIGIFVVVNEDFTANSASNPAAAGSIVTLYLTGLGSPGTTALDGAISRSANSAFEDFIAVEQDFAPGGVPVGVLYAGTAPELINGVDQVNVQLPPGLSGALVPLVVQTLGSIIVTSNPVTIYTH